MNPGFSYQGKPWGASTASDADVFQGVSGDIFRAIQERLSFSIGYADEPLDSSARSEVNRGGDWPFPETNVDRQVVWEWEVDLLHMTPKFERVYRIGRELGVDVVVMYFFRPAWRVAEWPTEVYIIDIEQQRVYLRKGTNRDTSMLVRQAFSDFVAGREP